VNAKPHLRFPGVYVVSFDDGTKKLATRNLVPGKTVYGEQVEKIEGEEYRLWDPYRSKFSAAILNGLQTVPIRHDSKVLYLGAASGTTASHVSDIVGDGGHVYCIEFAPRSIRELVSNVCPFRKNVSPILADARIPERYRMLVQKVDNIYCDIAQPEQAKVLADNADVFLAGEGGVMLAIKAQSIDVTKKPSEIFKRERRTVTARGFAVNEAVHLEPYAKAHLMIVAEKEG
jgi:fibrillarin-like pre-rRNA processing protein